MLKLQLITDLHEAANDLRIQFYGVYLGAAALVDLSNSLTSQKKQILRKSACLYVTAALLGLLAWNPLVVHNIPAQATVDQFIKSNALIMGPYFIYFSATPIIAILIGALNMLRAARPIHSSMQDAMWLRPGMRHVDWIALGTIGLLFGSYIQILELYWLPVDGIYWWINPRALFATLFCVATAWQLGNEVLRVEKSKADLANLAKERYNTTLQIEHDIKNKLSNTIWNMRRLERSLKEDATEQKALDNLKLVKFSQDELSSAEDLLNLMLSAASFATKQGVRFGPKRDVEIIEFVENISYACMEAERSKKGIDAKICLERVRISCERSQTQVSIHTSVMKPVLTNLIENSLKFSPPCSTVFVIIGGNENELSVAVKDLGIGLTEEQKMNIFATNMFVERSLRSIHEGFGLGLPFSKSFLEAQGGTLDVRSDGPGEGSVFKATVPLA